MSTECRATFVVLNKLGLHARAASRLVNLANRFSSKIEVQKDNQRADAKSIMGVLLLCGIPGAKITVIAEGDDAEEAVASIGELFASRFGEDE